MAAFSLKITKRGDRFAQMERLAKPEAARIASRAAIATATVARQLVPVKTGFLRDSIFVEQTGETRFKVGASADYSSFIEYGTANSSAQPFLTPALELARREFERESQAFFLRVAA